MLKKIFRLSYGEIFILIKDILFTKHNENITRLVKIVKKLAGKTIKNALIIDIGAFDGNTSIQLSKAFPDFTIYAFEPGSQTFALAKKNCGTYRNIELYNIALSDKSGEAQFNITTNQVSSSLNEINRDQTNSEQKDELSVLKKEMVSIKSLDELNISKEIIILKIDTQGHEKEVLTGGKSTLTHTHFILIEMNNHDIYSGSSKYYEIDTCLRENNFKLADIIITYRNNGILIKEYDAIYINSLKYPNI